MPLWTVYAEKRTDLMRLIGSTSKRFRRPILGFIPAPRRAKRFRHLVGKWRPNPQPHHQQSPPTADGCRKRFRNLQIPASPKGDRGQSPRNKKGDRGQSPRNKKRDATRPRWKVTSFCCVPLARYILRSAHPDSSGYFQRRRAAVANCELPFATTPTNDRWVGPYAGCALLVTGYELSFSRSRPKLIRSYPKAEV